MIPYLPYQRKPFFDFCLEKFSKSHTEAVNLGQNGPKCKFQMGKRDESCGKQTLPMSCSGHRTVRRGVTVTRVEIAREGLERPRGRYVTLEVPRVSLLDERDESVIEPAAAELQALLPPAGPVLVLGVGNRRVTSDALGPRTVQKIFVTMGQQPVCR